MNADVSVDPQLTEMLAKLASLPAMHTLSPEASRAQSLAMSKARPPSNAPIAGMIERTIPGPAGDIPVRVYTPLNAGDAAPLLVYYHGGGHVFGSPETHHNATRNLCAGGQCVVVSVDYRKAPEHKFPAAVEDAFGVVKWCADNAAELNIDASRIAVAGDSAGGNLAIVAALMARDAGGPGICFQLLVYPLADYRCDSDSYRRYASGYGILEDKTMFWFKDHYLRSDADAKDWRASPLLAPNLGGLPETLVITAECDVLHDEGEALVAALSAAGTKVTHTDYAGMIHGFFPMGEVVDKSLAAQDEATAALRGQ